MKTYLPFFDGFYDSRWTPDDYLEYNCTNENERPYDWERDVFDYAAYKDAIGLAIVDIYQDWLQEVGIEGVTILYEKIDSPAFYNFETDRIFVDIQVTPEARRKIMEMFWSNESYIRACIKQNHTSCSGFVSFMSNKMEDWTETEIFADDNPPYLPCALDYILLSQMSFDDYSDMNEAACDYIMERMYFEQFVTFAEDLETA